MQQLESLGTLMVAPEISARAIRMAAIWRSGFRPLFLAGSLFGLTAMSLWLYGYTSPSGGRIALFAQREWHGHEMIFGFGGAMCGGFLLTAIPSWARTPEIAGRKLGFLVAAWCLGRSAMLLSPLLPPAATAAADLLYLPLLMFYIAPTVWHAHNHHYRWALPILGASFGGNLMFHFAMIAGDGLAAHQGVIVGYYSLMVLYSIIAGLLTPIFTQTWLEENNLAAIAPICPVLEWLSVLSVVFLAVADIAESPLLPVQLSAVAALAINTLRMSRWHSIHIVKSALLLPMHLGYFLFLSSILLRGVSAIYSLGNMSSAVHAFTIGAWGLTKFSLMTRVSLKHTGRPLVVPASMKVAFVSIGLAAAVRVLASFDYRPTILLPVAAVLWLAPLAFYLFTFASILLRPSVGRTDGNQNEGTLFPREVDRTRVSRIEEDAR